MKYMNKILEKEMLSKLIFVPENSTTLSPPNLPPQKSVLDIKTLKSLS